MSQQYHAEVAMACFLTFCELQLHSSTVNIDGPIGSLRLCNEQRCVFADKWLLISNQEQKRIKTVKVQEPWVGPGGGTKK